MTRRSIQERLRQLEARKQVLVARLGREERARDMRRKILVGALVLDRIERQPDRYLSGHLDEWLRAELPAFLTREKDRDLFEDNASHRREIYVDAMETAGLKQMILDIVEGDTWDFERFAFEEASRLFDRPENLPTRTIACAHDRLAWLHRSGLAKGAESRPWDCLRSQGGRTRRSSPVPIRLPSDHHRRAELQRDRTARDRVASENVGRSRR